MSQVRNAFEIDMSSLNLDVLIYVLHPDDGDTSPATIYHLCLLLA